MGQANAARDKLYDLRECSMVGADAAGFDISGALLAKGDFSKVNFKETQLSKARSRRGRRRDATRARPPSPTTRLPARLQVYGPEAKFDGADFTNGVVDRAYFNGGSFKGAIFKNTVLSGTSFDGSDLTDSDFTDAYIGMFDLKKLCKNPMLQGENPTTGAPTRESAGCVSP